MDLNDTDDVRYPGSKGLAGVAEWICDRLVDHVYYAEPFVGKGAVFRRKVPALRTLLIDKDPDICTWWDRRIQRGSTLDEADDPRGHRQKRRSRPKHIEVRQGCGIDWTWSMIGKAPGDLLVYYDPPYLLSTRVRHDLYRHEMSEADHERLLQGIVQLSCPVAISGYLSDLYAQYLAGWDMHTRLVVTRGGSLRTECLWTNASIVGVPAVSMAYAEFGEDYRRREVVGRKLKRWERKFQGMESIERRAILLALLNAERQIERNSRVL